MHQRLLRRQPFTGRTDEQLLQQVLANVVELGHVVGPIRQALVPRKRPIVGQAADIGPLGLVWRTTHAKDLTQLILFFKKYLKILKLSKFSHINIGAGKERRARV